MDAPKDRKIGILATVFIASGFAGLVYQVVFAKALGLTFGSTANAATVVLATYMGGLAIGSWLGGVLAKRIDPVKGYAIAELGIGVWCALGPVLLGCVLWVYTGLQRALTPQNRGWSPCNLDSVRLSCSLQLS